MDVGSLFSLRGRRALVTGSTRGIGLTISQALASAGAEALVNGRESNRVLAAVDTIRSGGGAARALAFDVMDAAAIDAAIELAESEFGPIDVLINNAGLQHRGMLAELTEEAFDEIVEVHLKAAFRVGRAVASRMRPRGRGSIINMCSILSSFARAGVGPYCAAKGGLANLTRAMATEWSGDGLRVNAIAPGYFRTDITRSLSDDDAFNTWLTARVPMGRWGELPELAGAAIFLASDAASYVNGHVLTVDGGMTASL